MLYGYIIWIQLFYKLYEYYMTRSNYSLHRIFDLIGLFFLLTMPLMMFCGIAICDISICAIAVLFLIRSIVFKDVAWIHIRWIQIALVLWVYVVVISFHAAVNVKASLSQAIPFGRFIFFAAGLQCWLLRSADYRRYLFYALVAALGLMTINTLFSFLTGLSLIGKSAIQYGHYHHIAWAWQRPYGRIMGINGKKSAGIMLTWIAMPVFAFLADGMKKSKAGIFLMALLGVLLVLLTVSITGDRMALLECGFGYLLLLLSLPHLRWQLLMPGIIVLVLLLGAFVVEPGLYHRNVASLLQDILHFSHDDYGVVTKTAMAIFYHYPIFGAGLKQYTYLSASFESIHLSDLNTTHAQNIYLEWLTGSGMIGTLLFLSMLFCWCQQFFKQRALICGVPIVTGVLVAFVLRIWPLASTTSFFFSWGAITFWWMGAWLLAITDQKTTTVL